MILFQGENIIVKRAIESDIKYILSLEEMKENNRFVWQGTYEEHLNEIKDINKYILGSIFNKESNKKIGYILCTLDNKSKVFELKRIVIEKKGMGYGKDTIKALLKYVFEGLNMNRFWLDVYTDHVVGIKLYESLGMVYEGTLRQSYKSNRGYVNQMIYSMLPFEYYQKKDLR